MQVYEGHEPYIFVSYSHKDASQVLPCLEALCANGYRVWYDSGIEAGTEWPAYIEDHLNRCARVVVFMSESAVESVNCRNEINLALKKGKDVLVVYLESTELRFGMDLQLGSSQSLFAYRHPNEESFLNELCGAKMLQDCKNEKTVQNKRELSQQPQLPQEAQDFSKQPKRRFFKRVAIVAAVAMLCLGGLTAYAVKSYFSEQNISADERYELAQQYYNGDGVEQDYAEAVKQYVKAAEQGHAGAQCDLGYCYQYGLGVEKDLTEAVSWYGRSAELGNSIAQFNLGYCYQYGLGVERDDGKAVYWYRKATDQDHAGAQCNLGYCYENGLGVEKDTTEAVKLYCQSAEQGNSDAQYNAAYCYENGVGVEQNYTEAVRWYREAAEQGHAKAQFSLGICYLRGNGIEQDYSEAIKWYRKSAEQNNMNAQNNLGACYEYGVGVEMDLEQAVYWYRKAAEQGHENAEDALERLGY